jgi:hypothetical protein
MNTHIKHQCQRHAGLLGLVLAASIVSVSSAHAGPVNRAVARIQSSVNALHTGVARTMSKIDQLRKTLKDLPEAQRKIILEKFKQMNDPTVRRQRVDNMVNTMEEVSEPVQQFTAQLMSKMQGKLAQRMRRELVDGQPGPIGASFGLLYDLTNPIQQALLEGDSGNSTRSVGGLHNQHPNHYQRGLLEDPQTLDDCIAHKSNRDEPSRADARCVIRLLAKPAGSWICEMADYTFDIADATMPNDVSSFWAKLPGIVPSATVKGVCVIAKGLGSLRNAVKVDDALRFKIESNLMGDKPLAMFQLPGQFGGKLEVVERVVYDTIENAKAAGFNLGNAENEYAVGGDSFSNKQYGQAYVHFANAYREIVNSN